VQGGITQRVCASQNRQRRNLDLAVQARDPAQSKAAKKQKQRSSRKGICAG
jgi:hypothetical protein